MILIVFLAYSCNNKSKSSKNNQPLVSNADKKIEHSKVTEDTLDDIGNSSNGLFDVFLKAKKAFPDDSASLYSFYYKLHLSKDEEKLDKQIERLEALTSKKSIDRYNEVNRRLKPLLVKITSASSLSKSQADSLVILYSDYDYFSGEALFSQLLTNDDNYNLVWESFRIMTKESKRDTSYISALITLDTHIRTNVELAEAMPDFIVQAIQNNPNGFLEMYRARRSDLRSDFANYISVYDEPDKKLIVIYTDISKNSENDDYKKLAQELMLKFEK